MSQLVEYEQPTSTPVPKVLAAGQAGAGIAAVVTLLALTGVTVPDNISESAKTAIVSGQILVAALQAIFTFAAAYIKKDKKPVAAVGIIKSQTDTNGRG